GFTWLIFLGAALGVRQGKHVSVDIVPDLLSPALRKPVLVLRDILVALAMITLTFSGFELAQMVGGVSVSLQWPNALRFGIIPVAGGIGLLFLLLERTDATGLLRQAGVLAAGGCLYLLIRQTGLSPFGAVSPSLLMTLAFFLCMAIGVPVAFSMLLGVFFTTWSVGLLPAPAILQNMVAGGSKFILLAIPFFLTAGYLLNIGGLSSRLIDFAAALVGHLRGGLAHVNVLNSVLVGGVSGSSGADAASTSKVLVPEMVKRGYPAAFACAVTAASSILPNIIPPAIAMLVYASVSNVSIAKLFIAGILPGLLIAAAMMATVAIIARQRGYEGRTVRAPMRRVWSTFLRALPALAIAFAVLGCIRFGVTTATEAGVIAVLWSFALGKFVFRECNWRDLYRALVDSGIDSALIGFLIAASVPFAWVLIADGLPQAMIGWARSGDHGPTVLLMILVLSLFAAGMFLDLTPAMLIAAPLFLPLMLQAGIDPVQLGIIMIITLQLGGVTPPVGILVFITAQITRIAPGGVFREVLPFLIAVLLVLGAVCAFPVLTLGIWALIG
ncbi:MAG TPA: TRAP transporter large permease subunit, partial [Paracoccaceae bacterium]